MKLLKGICIPQDGKWSHSLLSSGSRVIRMYLWFENISVAFQSICCYPHLIWWQQLPVVKGFGWFLLSALNSRMCLQVDQPEWQVHRLEKYWLLVSSQAHIWLVLEHIAKNLCTWVLVLFEDGDHVDSIYFSGKKKLFASLSPGYPSRR